MRRNPNVKPAFIIYVAVFVSQFIGLVFGLHFLDAGDSVLYESGVLIDREWWGTLLFIAATTAQGGLLTKIRGIVQVSSIAVFSLWFMALVELGLHGDWYVMVTVAGLHIAFWSYVYMTYGLGLINRQFEDI